MSTSLFQSHHFYTTAIVVFAVMLFYNLLLYFVVRSRTYLFYSFLLLSLSLHVFIHLVLELGENSIAGEFSVLTATLCSLGLLLFVRDFLELKKSQYTRWNFLFVWLLITAGMILLFQLINMFGLIGLTDLPSYLAALQVLATLLLSFTCAIFLFRKEKFARLFILTSLPLIVGSMLYTITWIVLRIRDISEIGISPAWSTYLFISLCILQMVMFSVVIGYKFKLLDSEKILFHRTLAEKLEEEVEKQTRTLRIANEQIELQNKELEDINNVKNKMFSLVAHDLRNSLNAVYGLVHVLPENQMDEQEMQHFVKLIDARLKTSSDVMNQLLKWAVTQLEGMHVKKQWLDLEDLIEENVNFFSEPIKEKNLVISTDIRHSAAYADREMISTTIRNLLSNSIKFSHSGKTIYIATSAKQETVYLSIRDEGVGMNLTWYNSLAENGILTTKSGTQGEQGTGFGLVITRDFVRMNGGELECESEEGVGTKFTIVLPLKK